jgi:hypothetical protein
MQSRFYSELIVQFSEPQFLWYDPGPEFRFHVIDGGFDADDLPKTTELATVSISL